MHAIAFVFVLLLAAAGLWHAGQALLKRRRGPDWLAQAVDQHSQVVLVLVMLPIVVLLAAGLSAVVLLGLE